jgi:N-methylhydantoinase A
MAGKRYFSVGVDIGGTFTDIVVIERNGTVHSAKVLSTTDAYERGILDALAKLCRETGLSPPECEVIAHGTTVATNAIIERKGAFTGLITTAGFRDVLELRRIRVPRLYDLTWEKPTPLVERWLRCEVPERITHRGEVHTRLDTEVVRRVVRALVGTGVQSIAVCLINAYANPAHEEEIRRIIAAEAPKVDVTISSEILAEMREYERTSTAVINAYVMPIVRRYVSSLEAGLAGAGFSCPLLLMQSNGGTMAAALASTQPVHIIESGPAAGVVAAQHLSKARGIKDAITLDIGGTTAKASLIEKGLASFASEYEVGAAFTRAGRHAKGGGYVLRASTLDISEIGAGGGSIVRLDSGGALRVGPDSAGAMPGPVCYGRGGTEPTLTDACLVLGYLDPAGLAGGAVKLDRDAALAALETKVARPLGLDVIALAYGALRIAASNMTRAIRSVSTERGKDPRDFDLIAFGGNGGLFSAAVARELEIPRIIVPPSAGIFSAFGLLYSEFEHHFTRTLLGPTDRIDPSIADERWAFLEHQATDTLAREGFPPHRSQLRRYGQMRYVSQTHELAVPWPAGPTTPACLAQLARDFEDIHERTWGHRGHDSAVELVNLHLVAIGVPEHPRVPERLVFPPSPAVGEKSRRAYFGPKQGWHEARVVVREDLPAAPQPGPIIVREFDSTILVPPDFDVIRDPAANVILTRRPDR